MSLPHRCAFKVVVNSMGGTRTLAYWPPEGESSHRAMLVVSARVR
jgi:hypothetical protein